VPSRETLAFTATTLVSIESSSTLHHGHPLDDNVGQSARALPSFHVGGDQGVSCPDVAFPLTDQTTAASIYQNSRVDEREVSRGRDTS